MVTPLPPGWVDEKALEIARQFGEDGDGWQRQAQLQAAIADALNEAIQRAVSPAVRTGP